MVELTDKNALLKAYDENHVGPPGGARKLIEEAPAVSLEDALKAQASTIILYRSPAADDPDNNNCASGVFEGDIESLVIGLSYLMEEMAGVIAMGSEWTKIFFALRLHAAYAKAIEVLEA